MEGVDDMKNPWPPFCIFAGTSAVLLVYNHFFPVQTMWIAVAAVLGLVLLWIFLYIRYERWLMRGINPYVMQYQQDHDIRKLEQGMALWRKRAWSRYAKNVMLANWFSALLEQKRFSEAEAELEKFRRRARTMQDQLGYHLLRKDYAAAAGDQQMQQQEQQLIQRLQSQMGAPKEEKTAAQSRGSFFYWLSFSVFLFTAGFVCIMMTANDTVRNLGAWSCILSVLALAVSLMWLAVWLIRRGRERKEQTA